MKNSNIENNFSDQFLIDSLTYKISQNQGVFSLKIEITNKLYFPDNNEFALYLYEKNIRKNLFWYQKSPSFTIPNINFDAINIFVKSTDGKVVNKFISIDKTKIPRKILVYGGCVSRDTFNPEYNTGAIAISDYIARYSIAKLLEPSINIDETQLKNITSPFQRKLIINDAKNNLIYRIRKNNFDYILMDFMFVKYNFVYYEDTLLTYSDELKNSKIIKDKEMILNTQKEYLKKIELSLRYFFHFLDEEGILDKLIINKVFYAYKDQNNHFFQNSEYIDSINKLLSSCYEFASKNISVQQFLTYDSSLFIANTEHRWGVSPMHYTDSLYHKMYHKLKRL